MTTIQEMAKDYESKETKNVAELNEIPVALDIRKETFKTKEGKEFTVNLITVDGEDYRVPDMVLKQLKQVLLKKPDTTIFTVAKDGTGMNTNYTVVPLR